MTSLRCAASLALAVPLLTLTLGPRAQEAPAAAAPAAASSTLRWFKGNTHTHTLNSDGDSSPGEVAHWYRDRGYDFLSLTDHNYHTVIDELQRELDKENTRAKRKPFLLIPGEEVTDELKVGAREVPLHVNGLATTRLVGKQGGASIHEVVQRCIDAIRAAGGLPSVNHPNFEWALRAEDLAKLENLRHFEIFNGHPGVHNLGGGGSLSLEEMWDVLLSSGKRLYGVAVDDAHDFQGEFSPEQSNPGRGWIVVRAAALEAAAIVAAIDRGDFYASTGIELEDLKAESGVLSLAVRARGSFRYRTSFIGKGGRVLKVDETLKPSCALGPGEPYLRARVVASGGQQAWTQPLFAQ